LPRGGAALKPVLRATQNCRIFIENDHQRLYACYFERFLKTLGVTVDLTVWKETVRKKKDTLEFHLAQLQRDKDSICAICIHEDDPRRKTATVHIFKNELEGKNKREQRTEYITREREAARLVLLFRTQKHARSRRNLPHCASSRETAQVRRAASGPNRQHHAHHCRRAHGNAARD